MVILEAKKQINSQRVMSVKYVCSVPQRLCREPAIFDKEPKIDTRAFRARDKKTKEAFQRLKYSEFSSKKVRKWAFSEKNNRKFSKTKRSILYFYQKAKIKFASIYKLSLISARAVNLGRNRVRFPHAFEKPKLIQSSARINLSFDVQTS